MATWSAEGDVAAASPAARKKQRAAGTTDSGSAIGHRFQIIDVLGTGSFGVVYKARDRRTGEIVAMKCLRTSAHEGSSLYYSAFANEVGALEACSGHPSIVQPRASCCYPSGDGEAFFVMEFVGPTLSHVMKRVRFGRRHTETEVRLMMRQLLAGARRMHRLGLIHRDLKPDNVLVDGRGSLKICDLGLSCSIAADGPPRGSHVGTLRYRAPELLLGSTDYDGRVDSWALGVMMAELLAGKHPFPFHGNSDKEQLNAILDVLGTKDIKQWSGYDGTRLPGGCPPDNILRYKFPCPQEEAAPCATEDARIRRRPALSEAGFEVLSGLLQCNPEKRLTASRALQHRWFKETNLPRS